MVGGETGSIFGFAEFVAALAILMIIYNLSDVRYRFRISIAIVPILPITFGAIVLIGAGALLIDVWYAEGWPTLPGFVGQAGLQAIFGTIFLALICVWMAVAFLWPPIFGRGNAERFAQALYQRIIRGSDAELSVIADEMARSAAALVKHCPENVDERNMNGGKIREITKAQGYAHDIFLLIGNRRFCRQVARDAPQTAMAIFDAMAKAGKYRLPLAQFAQNVASQMLINEDSILYHESDEFSSDLIGRIKPFSRVFFGNFDLVEALTQGANSPLAVRWWQGGGDLNARQYETFSAALQALIASYIATARPNQHPRSIVEGISVIEHLTSDLHRLNDLPMAYQNSEIYERLQVSVRFLNRAVMLLERADIEPKEPVKKSRNTYHQFDLYDELADLAFKIIFDASAVDGEWNWSVQHNSVWAKIHDFNDSPAWVHVRRRLHRRLYDEVRRMDEFINYKGAGVVAFLLNVLGVEATQTKKSYDRNSRPLHVALIGWVQRNYLRIHSELPDVAARCLVGGITFDQPNNRLVKTYSNKLSPEPARRYLNLTPLSRDDR